MATITDDYAAVAEENKRFAFEIIERVENNTGIQMRDLFEGDKDPHDIRNAMRDRVIAYVQDRLEKEKPSEEWPLAGTESDARAALGILADPINLAPNVAVSTYNYKILKGLQGQEQNDYVKKVSNGLSLIKDGQTAGEVAAEIIGSGLAAFALKMIWGTVKAMRGGLAFRAALVQGVRAMGAVSSIVGVAILIITEILLYLVISNKKQFLGIVYNNTDFPLVVKDWRSGTDGANKGDLYVSTGRVSSWMEQNEDEKLDSPLVQIGARLYVGKDDPDNIVLGGIFFGEKNVGLYGTEGVMVLQARTGSSLRFCLLFACPYTMDNGVNVHIDTTNRSAKDVFNALYDSRSLFRQVAGSGYLMSARTAWKTGGQTMGLAWIEKN